MIADPILAPPEWITWALDSEPAEENGSWWARMRPTLGPRIGALLDRWCEPPGASWSDSYRLGPSAASWSDDYRLGPGAQYVVAELELVLPTGATVTRAAMVDRPSHGPAAHSLAAFTDHALETVALRRFGLAPNLARLRPEHARVTRTSPDSWHLLGAERRRLAEIARDQAAAGWAELHDAAELVPSSVELRRRVEALPGWIGGAPKLGTLAAAWSTWYDAQRRTLTPWPWSLADRRRIAAQLDLLERHAPAKPNPDQEAPAP